MIQEEIYPAVESAVLAQRILDEGLVYAINRLVLNGAGLAFTVHVHEEDGLEIPIGLALHQIDVVRMSESEAVREQAESLARLRAHGYGVLAAELAEMDP